MINLKRVIWLYLILLVFEGALRKWFAPGLATPLLIIRDPLAAFLIFQAFRFRLMPSSPLLLAMFLVGFIAIPIAVIFGHGNPLVAAFGARPFILHFPAMFVIARVLNHDDLVQMGRFLMVVSVGMSALLVLQFYSPQFAFVNVGVGGEGSAGFAGALGYFRPSGTFSFTSGVAQFYALLAPFVIYGWLRPGVVNRVLLLLATGALILALPFSISRTLIFQVGLTILFAVLVASANPRLFIRTIGAGFGIVVLLFVLASFGVFGDSLDVMTARFTMASEFEGGLEGTLVDRYLGGLFSVFINSDKWPLFGMGIGMGTNVGAQLLSGEVGFLIAEGEWQRVGGELGIFLALVVISLRVWLTLYAGMLAYSAQKRGDILPWLLLANAATLLPQGDWAQPTGLGFSMVAGAFLLASLKGEEVHADLQERVRQSSRSFGSQRGLE